MLLRRLISAIGLAALKGEVSAILQRATRRALLMTIVLLLWLATFGFTIATLAVWLSAELGPIAACGIIAAGFAVVGLAIQVCLALSARRRRRARVPPGPRVATNPGGSPNANAGNLGALAIVAVAGYLLGRRLFRN